MLSTLNCFNLIFLEMYTNLKKYIIYWNKSLLFNFELIQKNKNKIKEFIIFFFYYFKNLIIYLIYKIFNINFFKYCFKTNRKVFIFKKDNFLVFNFLKIIA